LPSDFKLIKIIVQNGTTKEIQCNKLGPGESIGRVMLKTLCPFRWESQPIECKPENPARLPMHTKRNEEIYLFTEGKGLFWLDGEILHVKEAVQSGFHLLPVRCLKLMIRSCHTSASRWRRDRLSRLRVMTAFVRI